MKSTTAKLTWLAETEEHKQVDIVLVEVDHIITVPKLEEDQELEDVVNENSWLETKATGEAPLRNIKKGEIVQLNRRGFFVCESEYKSAEEPLTLIYVPDGNQKATSVLSSKVSKKVEPTGPSKSKEQQEAKKKAQKAAAEKEEEEEERD